MNIQTQYSSISSPHLYPAHKIKHCLSRSPSWGKETSLTPIKKLSQESIQQAMEKNHLQSTLKRNKSSNINYGIQKPFTTNNSPLKAKQKHHKNQTSTNLTPTRTFFARENNQNRHEKKLSCLRNKIIQNLKDIRTIETKYDDSLRSKQITQESAVIFKGSRDVQGFIPVKLCYDEREKFNNLAETKHSSRGSTIIKTNNTKKIHIIRKSDKNKYLVREVGTGGVYFFYHHVDSEYSLIPMEGQNVVNVYSNLNSKIFVVQPYEYTFNELLSMGKVTQETIKTIKNKIMGLKKEMEKEAHRQIQFAPMSEIVYYIHGILKILPLVKKKYLLTHLFQLKKLRGRN